MFAFAIAEQQLSREDIKKYAQADYDAYNKNVKKTVEDGVKVYAHVHHSLASENDKIVWIWLLYGLFFIVILLFSVPFFFFFLLLFLYLYLCYCTYFYTFSNCPFTLGR